MCCGVVEGHTFGIVDEMIGNVRGITVVDKDGSTAGIIIINVR